MGAAVTMCLVQLHHTLHEGLDLRDLGHGLDVLAPAHDPARPGDAEGVEGGHVAAAGSADDALELLELGGAERRAVDASDDGAAKRVVERTLGQPLRSGALGLEEGRGICAVEVGAGTQELAVARLGADEAVDEQQIRRPALLDGLGVGVVEDGARERIAELPALAAHEPPATRQHEQCADREGEKPSHHRFHLLPMRSRRSR